jgi:hypothetical protein
MQLTSFTLHVSFTYMQLDEDMESTALHVCLCAKVTKSGQVTQRLPSFKYFQILLYGKGRASPVTGSEGP